jgi:hypothetical protein
MGIVTLQRQMRELGRIRTGNQVAAANGRRLPNKLDTFRLTSESRELIDAAAEAFGGTVVPWKNDGKPEFEVIVEVTAIDIVVPPGQPVSQWYEMWSGGGCQRRCDGITNVLTMEPCLCPEDTAIRLDLAAKGEACKATTRLNVILPQLPDLGVWRLESHGYYAAVHLAGAAEILAMASERGQLIPARLRLVEGTKKVPGQPTRKWFEPVIQFVDTRFGDLGLTALAPGGVPQLAPGAAVGRPQLPSTALPPTSDFRAPSALAAVILGDGPIAGDRLGPEIGGPDRVAASDAPGAPASDPVPMGATAEAIAQPAQPDAAERDPDGAAPVASLTVPELLAALEGAGIPQQVALDRSKELYPREPGTSLTGEQRAALFADLTAPAVAL